MQNPIIDIHQLGKRYGKTDALYNITLSVNQETFLTVVGPNGSGKTTLLHILATLSQPTSGYVTLNGVNPATDGNTVRRLIGLVSHVPLLYPALTAYENLTFYGNMFDLDRLDERIEHLLHEFDLFARMHDPVRTFSRGMQQRLSIVRAMLHNPQVLLFDEPYTGLDRAAVKVLQQMLERSRTAGRTIVLTTHDMQHSLDQADEAAVLVGGRLTYYGPPRALDPARLAALQ